MNERIHRALDAERPREGPAEAHSAREAMGKSDKDAGDISSVAPGDLAADVVAYEEIIHSALLADGCRKRAAPRQPTSTYRSGWMRQRHPVLPLRATLRTGGPSM